MGIPTNSSLNGAWAKSDMTPIPLPTKIEPNRIESSGTSNENKSNPKKVMVILSIFGSSPIVAGKDTSGNSFIEILNLKNIANDFSGWKAVGIEHITKMNPDVILITKRGSRGYDNPQKLANSQMFKYTNAAKKKKFFILDGLAMLGFSPRTLTLAIDTINLINKHE